MRIDVGAEATVNTFVSIAGTIVNTAFHVCESTAPSLVCPQDCQHKRLSVWGMLPSSVRTRNKQLKITKQKAQVNCGFMCQAAFMKICECWREIGTYTFNALISII